MVNKHILLKECNTYSFDKEDIIIIIAILIGIVYFASLLIYKHEVYATYAWDLGIFAQALKSTLEGNLMYHTPQLYTLTNGNHMFIHFTPILLLLLPIYAIAPYATTLLIIKPILTFAAAYPLYLIGKRLSDKLTALLIAILYMSHPLLNSALWFDFQFAVFFPLLLFLTIYTYISNRKIFYFISIGLLALVSEQGALYAFIISVIHTIPYLFSYIKRTSRYISWLFINNTHISFKYILLTLALTFLYYLVVTNFLEYSGNNYIIKETREIINASGNFFILGYKGNNALLPLYAITHPSETLNALQWEFDIKIAFIFLVYGILAFLPLQSIYGLTSLPIIFTFLVSNFSSYYKLGPHYPYYYIGFLFIGFVMVITKIDTRMNRIRILSGVTIATIFFLISTAPWSPFSESLSNSGLAWYYSIPSEKDPKIRTLDMFVELANKEGAPLLVQNHVFTHTTMSSNVYVLPPYELYPINSTYFNNYIQNLIKKSDLILLDLTTDPLVPIVLEYTKDGFGIYAEENNVLLLKRGYTDNPIYFNIMCGNMLRGTNTNINGNTISLSQGKEGILVYGPYRFITEGTYVVTYEIRAKSISTLGGVAVVDVVSDLGTKVYSKRVISGYELYDNKWHNITLTFNLDNHFKQGMEFRVYSLGNTDLEFNRCIIERLDIPAGGDVGILAKDLKFNVGFKNDNIVTLHNDIKTDLFWYGPNILIREGVYLAEVYLKIEPEPFSDVIRIDIVDDNEIIRSIFLNKDTLTPIGADWYIANIPFMLDDLSILEIIGKFPNSNYTISISHINIKSL